MKSILPLLLMALSAVSFLSCRDDRDDDSRPAPPAPIQKEEQLPPITSTGAGTFGCRVNGKVWVAKNKGSFPHVYSSVDRNHQWYVNISGSIIQNPVKHDMINIGYYFLPNKSRYSVRYNNDNGPGGSYTDVVNNTFWITDSLIGGEVLISRFDTIHQIISGTFEFNCINTSTHDTLRITDGRFDMNFLY